MCKLRCKLRNAKIYPIEVRILRIIFLDVILWTIKATIPHIWAHIIKTVFSKLEFLFSVPGSMVSKNICKLRHKLKNAKNLPELTWSWQNKPWSILWDFTGSLFSRTFLLFVRYLFSQNLTVQAYSYIGPVPHHHIVSF